MKWYGWGKETTVFSAQNRPAFIPYLREKLGEDVFQQRSTINIADIRLKPSSLSAEARKLFSEVIGAVNVRMDGDDRIRHSMGKSYVDLIRIRKGDVPNPPDAVLYPADAGEVQRLLTIAAGLRIAVVPFGGGTSVVGGVEGIKGPNHTAVVCIDLLRLNRLLQVDRESRVATAEAGIRGPDLETALNAEGFSLGHFPQSFEFSTLEGGSRRDRPGSFPPSTEKSKIWLSHSLSYHQTK